MSLTVRLWSKEDLQDIRENRSPLKTTIFMNVKTFSREEIKVYPYYLRKTYNVYFKNGDEPAKIYATDDDTLRRFLRKEYHYDYITAIDEVITEYRAVRL